LKKIFHYGIQLGKYHDHIEHCVLILCTTFSNYWSSYKIKKWMEEIIKREVGEDTYLIRITSYPFTWIARWSM